MKWPFLAGAIVFEVAATLSLRHALEHPLWIVLVVVGYAGSFVCLAGALRTGLAIGVAYGIWAAFGVALTAILGALIYGDPLTWTIALGIAVVIAGVLLIEFGSHIPSRKPDRTEASR